MIKLTCLMDNLPSENKALCAEHGLSVHVETQHGSFLFDCGSGVHTLQNAHRLGIDLSRVGFSVLSHSHYDHAAGFRDLAEHGMGGKRLYTGEDFFQKKYADNPPKLTDLSCGFDADFLTRFGVEHTVCGDMLTVLPGVRLIADFPRVHAFETIPTRFVRGTPDAVVRDDFHDEICVVLEMEKGLVMLVGCSHPGILNMAESVYRRMERPIYAVLGGTHLVEADGERIARTAETLKAMGVKLFGLSHCSGSKAEETIGGDAAIASCHLAVGDCIAFS